LQKTAYLYIENGKLKYILAKEEEVRVRAKLGLGTLVNRLGIPAVGLRLG
jgi:hypothetical protein